MTYKLTVATLVALMSAVQLALLPTTAAQPQTPPCVAPCFNVIYLVNITGKPAVGSPAWTTYVNLLKKTLATPAVNAKIRTFALFQSNPVEPPPRFGTIDYFPYSVGIFFTFAGVLDFQAYFAATRTDPSFTQSRTLIEPTPLYFAFQKPSSGTAPQPQPKGPPCVQFSCFNVIFLQTLINSPPATSCTYKTFEELAIKTFAASNFLAAYQLSPSYSPSIPLYPTFGWAPYTIGSFFASSSPTAFWEFRGARNVNPDWIAVRGLSTMTKIVSFTLIP